jgi:hypothetical protein
MTCPEEMGGTNGLQSLHLTGFMVLERELLCLQKQLNILQWDVIKGFSFNFVCWGCGSSYDSYYIMDEY